MAKQIKVILTFEEDPSNEYVICRIPDGQKEPQVRFGTVDEEWQLDMTVEEAIELADEIRNVAHAIRADRTSASGLKD